MALILNIETSTSVCSVSLSKNGNIIDIKESFEDKSHASLLTIFIQDLLKNNSIDATNLDAISVSEGPGSYTGLRIGVSTAKGVCYAKSIPLIAINTMQSMALMAKTKLKESNMLFCPMIDARRMEVYSALFNNDIKQIRKTIAEVIDNTSYNTELDKNKIAFFGDGANKCKQFIKHKNSTFISNIYPSSNYMGIIAEKHFNKKEFKDVAYFEPFYLKDFVATTPKKRMF